MTKTLTEQYKFGEIKTGYYWCKIWGDDNLVIKWLVGDNEMHQSNLIEEVIAPVHSYDAWKQAKENLDKNGTWYTERSYKLIEKKLDIAVNALEWYSDYTNSTKGVFNMKPEKEAQEALKQIKELDK